MKLSKVAKEIVKSTYKNFTDGGAYSALAYSRCGWEQATEKLLRMDLTAAQVEQVLRSKATRWARDAAPTAARYGRYSSVTLMTYLGTDKKQIVNDWCE